MFLDDKQFVYSIFKVFIWNITSLQITFKRKICSNWMSWNNFQGLLVQLFWPKKACLQLGSWHTLMTDKKMPIEMAELTTSRFILRTTTTKSLKDEKCILMLWWNVALLSSYLWHWSMFLPFQQCAALRDRNVLVGFEPRELKVFLIHLTSMLPLLRNQILS